MREFFRSLLCVALFLLSGGISTAAEPERGFRAGAYAIDITPTKFPVSVNGGMADIQATAAHDPLHARCLVLDDGHKRIAFAVCDSMAIPRSLMEDAKQQVLQRTGIPVGHILISATHSHSTVSVTSCFQSDPMPAYQKFMAAKIAEGIEKAVSQLKPARIGWGKKSNPTQLFNRRWYLKPGAIGPDPFGRNKDQVRMNPGQGNPNLVKSAGPIDPEVSILVAQGTDGQPIALLANYSLHYVGGVGGSVLSADYFGMFAERISQLLNAQSANPPFVAIMSNGTSGDVNNVNFALKNPPKREPYEQMKLVAESVAQTAFEAYQEIQFHDAPLLDVREREIDLGVRQAQPGDLERAEKILAKVEPKGRVLRGLDEIYARETIKLNDSPKTVHVKLQAIRIGDLAILAIPCEVFTQIGLDLKQKSPFKQTFTIELANGYFGYLPTPEQHKLGGYETWRARSSFLEEEASPKIMQQLQEMLGELHAATKK
ncbi:MAG: hypothetical protein U0903_13610 [Planctomycetales bacterium]